MTLLGALRAPEPRTLVEVFEQTVAAAPDELALDNGAVVLTYAEFAEAAEEVASALNAIGVTVGDRVGVRIALGHGRPVRRHHGHPRGRRLLRPRGRR